MNFRISIASVAAIVVATAGAGAVAAAQTAQNRPVSVQIVWGHGRVADEGRPGNVRVTLANGHRELWTRKGNCLLPQVAKSGLVGWSCGPELHSSGTLMNDTLVIARDGEVMARIETEYSFIDVWNFTDNDRCVVVLSRGPHGPGRLEKFRAKDGEYVDGCFEGHVNERPHWATRFLQKAYEEGWSD